MEGKTIVAFGNFDLHGARSWVIRTGLTEAGYRVALCRTEASGLFGKCRDLWRRWREFKNEASAIYVVFLGHYLMPLAWLLSRRSPKGEAGLLGKRAGIPVIFDALVSLYDTEVNDRRRVSRFSPYAWVLWMTDWLGFRLADIVLVDTDEHAHFFTKTFGVDPQKMIVTPVGCRADLFTQQHSSKPTTQPFNIEFHGTYIPLQGAETILTAARELLKKGEDVQFTLIGTQMEQALMPLATEWGLHNVRFHRSVSIDKIPQFIRDADVCLGIFGTTAKADRVIPNKAYEVISCGKPLITGNTTAARRVFRDRENVVLCRCGDAGELVDAILLLKKDAELRSRIAEGGLTLSQEKFQPGDIVIPLLEWLRRAD